MGKDLGSLDDFFGSGKAELSVDKCTCHSGGAVGADTVFEEVAGAYGVKTNAYSYKTPKHTSANKVEISDVDYKEGVDQINKANRRLGRYGIQKYMNLLARNWAQVKYSRQVFAVGTIVDPGKKDAKGYKNSWTQQIVSGGTGYAVMMAVLNDRDVYVYEQNIGSWFRWSAISDKFVRVDSTPKITDCNFAGIGTRDINSDGVRAIRNLFSETFGPSPNI